MAGPLAGRRALVTGSTRGVGRAAAELMLAQGAEVVLHGRDPAAVEAAVDALRAAHPAARGVAGDLADRRAVGAVAAAAGEVDVLVNSAGVFETRSMEAIDAAHWASTLATNLTAPWLLARALLPGLRRRRGAIVNVAADAALVGFSGGSAYCASKGALVGLTRALAVELAPEVRALCVCPGPVETDMMARAVAAAPDPAAERRRWEAYAPLGRAARPFEIARVIAFAASDAASFATGAVWAVDGGVSAGRRV